MLCKNDQYIIPIGKQGVELVAISSITWQGLRANTMTKHLDIDLQIKYNDIDVVIQVYTIGSTRYRLGPSIDETTALERIVV